MESVDWKLVRAAQVPGDRCRRHCQRELRSRVAALQQCCAGPGQHDAHIRTGTLNDRLSTGGWSGHTGKVRLALDRVFWHRPNHAQYCRPAIAVRFAGVPFRTRM